MQIRILSAALIAAFALAACGGSNNTAPAAQEGASAASPAAASDKVALDIKIIFRTVFGGKMVNDEKLQ